MTHWLLNRMMSLGDKVAITADNHSCTYSDLVRLATKWREHPVVCNAPPGSVFSLEGGYSPDAVGFLLALLTFGHIIVPIGKVPLSKREEFLDVASVEYRFSGLDDTDCTVSFTGRKADHVFYSALRDKLSAGLVLFSSGTTGRSKASVLNFSKMVEKHATPRKPKITLGFLTLDHIGGINTLLHTIAHGGKLVAISPRTPDLVCQAIEKHLIEVLPTTPTFINICLISGAFSRYNLTSLKLITYGTEPMPPVTLARLNQLLPNVRLKQTYGLSEVGILPTVSRNNNDLWLKIGGNGFDYKIVSNILWIKSDTAMLGYLNADAPFDEDGYFNTQDMVEVDGEWLRILGRRSEIINVGGEKVYPAEVEDTILQLPDILDVTVSGRPNPITGMVVQAVVRPAMNNADSTKLKAFVREHCEKKLDPFKVPAWIVISTDEQHSDRFKKTRKVVPL